MQKNKSGFTWFYNFILFDGATADTKNAFRPYKSQTTVIIQASWQINISTFNIVYCNKLRTNDVHCTIRKNIRTSPNLHRKMIGF